MKSDESSNSSTNRCTLQRTVGKTYQLLIPTSVEQSRNIKTNPIVKQLGKTFDYVLALPAEHCFTPERAKLAKCKKGIEATIIRRENDKGSAQEEADRESIFKIADAGVGKFDKPVLLDVNDDITFYSFKCD